MSLRRALLIGPLLDVSVASRRLIREALEEEAFIIAVDGGADACRRLGISPDLAIGDWDSLRSRSSLTGIPRIDLPQKKDKSDFLYALEVALKGGAREITVLGFSGGRPDQELAVWLDSAHVVSANRRLDSLTLRSAEADFHFVSKRHPLELELPRGTIVSVFAVAGLARGVTLTGFHYALKNASLEPSSRGLSNVTTARPTRIQTKTGMLLVIALK